MLLGQNVLPDRHDPIADTLDPDRVAGAMAQLRESYAAAASSLPGQEQFLPMAKAWSGA